jgi:EpsI family protein
VAAAATLLPRPAEIFPMRESFDEFPSELGDRVAHRGTLEGVYLDTLKLDDYLMADYSDGHSPAVNLYVAYYKSQRKGEAIHSPRSCLPGGGWQLSDFDQRALPEVKIKGRALRVNRSLIALGNERQLVYYWFEQRGRLLTNEFAVKWYLFWDAVTRHRTDGALVRVMTSISAGGNEADADRRLIDLTMHLAPLLSNYVPN